MISFFSLFSTLLFLIRFYYKPAVYLSNILWIPICLFAWSLVSIYWSFDFGNSLIELARTFSYLLILFLAIQIKHYKHQYFIINGAITACFIVVIIGLLQSIKINPFNIHYPGLPASTFINPNHASNYIEFFIPVLLILILYKNNTTQKILYSIILISSITFLYILSSLGTLIALSLAIFISGVILLKQANLVTLIKKNSTYLIIIVISTTLFISLYNSQTPAKQTSITAIKKTLSVPKNSHTMRLAVYLQSLEAVQDKPLTGFGYGGFRAGLLPYIADKQPLTKHNENRYYFELHNDFLQQTMETGIISGIVFFLFFIYMVFTGLNTLKHKQITDKNIFIFSISTGLLVITFHAFVSFPFHLSTSSLLIYLITGFILSTKTKKIFIQPKFRLKLYTLPLLILFSILFIYLSIYNVKHIQSSKLIRDAYIALYKEKNCQQAIDLIDKSNLLFKFDFDNQINQAQIYDLCPQPLKKLQTKLTNLINLNPTNFKARFLMGRVALLNNKLDLAFNNFYYITEMLPYSALGYIGLGDWAHKSNQFTNAQAYYKKALSLEPKNIHAQTMIKALNNQ